MFLIFFNMCDSLSKAEHRYLIQYKTRSGMIFIYLCYVCYGHTRVYVYSHILCVQASGLSVV